MVNNDYQWSFNSIRIADEPSLIFIWLFAVPPDDHSFNECVGSTSVSGTIPPMWSTYVLRRCERANGAEPDYDNRIDCLREPAPGWQKLIRFEIGSPTNCTRAKKHARSLNGRNARRCKMNDNVISVGWNREKKIWPGPVECARRVLRRLEIPGVKRLMFQLSIYTVHRAYKVCRFFICSWNIFRFAYNINCSRLGWIIFYIRHYDVSCHFERENFLAVSQKPHRDCT